MITKTQARKILGKEAQDMTDLQVEELIDRFYGLAEILVDLVGSKKKPKVIDSNHI